MNRIKLILKSSAVIIAFIIVFLSGCKKQEANNFGIQKIPVRVISPSQGDISEMISLSGNIEGMNSIDIFPKISGRIDDLSVEKGQGVKSGEKLALIEHSSISEQVKQFEATLEGTKLQLKQLEISLSNLEKDRERILALAQAGAVSEQRKDEIETRYQTTKEQQNQLQSQIKQTQAMLEQAKIQENESILISPIDGIVAEKFLEKGDMASPGRPAFKIIQVNTLKVITYLAEQYLSKINNDTVSVVRTDAYPAPEDKFTGKINRIAPTLDPMTRSAEIEIIIDNQDLKLKPGMSARIELTIETHKNVFIIPWDYVIGETGGTYYLLLAEDNKVKKQFVSLGIQSKGLVEITDGIKGDELIITTLGAHSSQGTEIEIVE